jgi:hypothetical protein
MAAAPPPALMWVDPGGMTGIATLEGTRFMASEYPFIEACTLIDTWCVHYHGSLCIGWEKFTIGPATHKLSPQPEAYELPGVIRYLAHRTSTRLLEPAMPSDRNTATPAELKALGWWTPGQDDAQSASQHLLAWLKRERCLPHELESKLARARSGTV